jgi:hypothetical protein
MKVIIPIFCLFISSLTAAFAQDTPTGDSSSAAPLPALSTVDDVNAFANDVASKLVDGRAEGAGFNFNLL